MENENGSEVRKYAGKFETVEDLEEGYKNSAKVYQENENLKRELDKYKAPDMYLKPKVDLDDETIGEIESIARSANMTQSQYDTLVMQTQDKVDKHKAYKESKIKAVSEEDRNLLRDYVDKNYSGETDDVKNTVYEKYMLDDSSRKAALEHRQRLLSNSIPGINSVSSVSYHVEYNDVLKAREKYQSNTSDLKLKDRYLKTLQEYNNQSNN